MPRYILIDRNSGYIFGDTADFAGGNLDLTPGEAASKLDASIGEPGTAYVWTGQHDPKATYDVFRPWDDAMPVVTDGQDQETIKAVERDGQFVTSLVRVRDLGRELME